MEQKIDWDKILTGGWLRLSRRGRPFEVCRGGGRGKESGGVGRRCGAGGQGMTPGQVGFVVSRSRAKESDYLVQSSPKLEWADADTQIRRELGYFLIWRG